MDRGPGHGEVAHFERLRWLGFNDGSIEFMVLAWDKKGVDMIKIISMRRRADSWLSES